ncbi:MAG: hypothetical protein GY711_34890 [bacterium]|nr:hypothetical protein [bacterium]
MITMSEGVLVALLASMLSYALSGARSAAYLLYFVGFVPFLTLDPSQGGMTDIGHVATSNVLFKLSFRVLTTAGFLVLLWRRRDELAWISRPQHLPVIGFFVWALASVQRAHVPWVALARLGEFLVFFLAGVALYLESARFHAPRVVARWHALALLQVLIAALYFALRSPDLAYHVGADGLVRLGHKLLNANSLGFAAAIICLWATSELFGSHSDGRPSGTRDGRVRITAWLLPAIALLVSAYVLLLARSRTAMVAVTIGQIVLWLPLHALEGRRRAIFLLGAVGAAALLVAGAPHVESWFLRGESAEALRTGTGRTELWLALLRDQVPRSPLIGAGYLSLSPTGTFAHAGREWNNAHNTYMFALVSNGVPGLVLVVAAVALPWFALLRHVLRASVTERDAWRLLLAFATVVGLVGVTEFGVCGYPNPVMFFHLTLYVFALAPLRATRSLEVRAPVHPPFTLLSGGTPA